jgi:hypothetical protein
MSRKEKQVSFKRKTFLENEIKNAFKERDVERQRDMETERQRDKET